MPHADAESLASLAARCSNHGRWGANVAPNALALLTPGRIALAAAQVRRGRVLSLAAADGTDPPTQIVTPSRVPGGVAGRGVLLDLPRAERRPRLDPGEGIDPERLDTCAERLGVAIEPGDLVLLRTGAAGETAATPGLSLACASWLYRREIPLVAADTRSAEATDPATPRDAEGPLFQVAFRHTGVVFGTGFALDRLASDCAEDGNYVFLLVIPPLHRVGANPSEALAIR